MKTFILATLGSLLLVSQASATQYRISSDDRGVTVHAPYQHRFDTRTRRPIDESSLSRDFALTAPTFRNSGERAQRRNRGLVYRSEGDPGIVLHGRNDGYGFTR